MNNAQPVHKSGFHKFLFFLKFLEIRLRFVFILLITALVVGYWDHIQNYYERWQRDRAPQSQTGPAGHTHTGEVAENEYEYYCAMHPFVVREAPGKCPICGMDLVQRKKGAPANLPKGTLARVQVSPERVMQAGIQVEPVAYRLLSHTVRSYGIIEPAETKMAKIVARFPGRIDSLMVNSVGLAVKKGEPLARIYSPKYMAATQEFIQALAAQRRTERDSQSSAEEKRRAAELTDYARQRLLLAGFTREQLSGIESRDKIDENVTLYAPLAGTVLEKNVLQGETVEEGTTLYTIADLSTLWVQAQIIEADMAAVKPGMPVEVTTVARPGEIFYGTVDFIYPTLNAENRSVKVRVVVENKNGELKPGMYITSVIRAPIGQFAPAKDFKLTATVENKKTPRPKLPTQTQPDADAFLATLPPGATYYECPMHSEVLSDKKGDCPKCSMHLAEKKKESSKTNATSPGPAQTAANAADVNASVGRWAVGYACPMHPDELSPTGGICKICGCGMKMEKMRAERVLSVPESAVIDTGTRQVVYVESSPGVYDARAVTLGPRADAYYPVLDGLKLKDIIATRGSFLIDAEARLNPATSAKAPEAGGEQQPAGKNNAPAAQPNHAGMAM